MVSSRVIPISFCILGRHVHLIKHDNDDDGISSSPKISCGGGPARGGGHALRWLINPILDSQFLGHLGAQEGRSCWILALVLPFVVSSSLLLPLLALVSRSQNLALLFLLLIALLHGSLQAVPNFWSWYQPELTGSSVSFSSVFLEPFCLVPFLIGPHRRLPLGFVYQAYGRHGQTIVAVSSSTWPSYWEDWHFQRLHCWFCSPSI